MNCFGPHALSNCRSKFKCAHCNEKHHTTLHEAIMEKLFCKSFEHRPTRCYEIIAMKLRTIHNVLKLYTTVFMHELFRTTCIKLSLSNCRSKFKCDDISTATLPTEQATRSDPTIINAGKIDDISTTTRRRGYIYSTANKRTNKTSDLGRPSINRSRRAKT